MLSFSALSILMWPNSCMYGLKKPKAPKSTTEFFINIYRKVSFFSLEKIKFQYCLYDSCSNLKSKQVCNVRSQAFIWLCAMLLCAVTGTGEITDVLASHRQSKKIPKIVRKYPELPQLNIIPQLILSYAKDRNKNIHLKLNIEGNFRPNTAENLPSRNFQLCSQK